MEEKEIKLSITSEDYFRLKSLFGPYFTEEKNQRDVYFDTDTFFYESHKHSIRLRYEEGRMNFALKILFYLDNREDWYVYEQESPLPISADFLAGIFYILGLDYDNYNQDMLSEQDLIDTLAIAGLKPKITITKKRNIYNYKGAEISLDYIKELGYFIEIEKHDFPWEIVDELGLKDYHEVRTGYTDIYTDKYYPDKLPHSSTIKQFYDTDSKWNVLKNEEDLYNNLNSKVSMYVGISGISLDLSVMYLFDKILEKKEEIYYLYVVVWDNLIQSSMFSAQIFPELSLEEITNRFIGNIQRFLEKNGINYKLIKMTDLIPKIVSNKENQEIIDRILSAISLSYLNQKFPKQDIDFSKIYNIILDYLAFYNSETLFGKKINCYFVGSRHKNLRAIFNKLLPEKNYQKTEYFESLKCPADGSKIRLHLGQDKEEIIRILVDNRENKLIVCPLLSWLNLSSWDPEQIYKKIQEKYNKLLV